MGLKIYNGEAMCNISFAKKDLGVDAYLYCPGPSLAGVDDRIIHGPGMVSFALNTAYPKVKPNVWIGMDYVECYKRTLWGESFRKVCRFGRQDQSVGGRTIKEYPEVYAATTKSNVPISYMFENREGHVPFAWFSHTFGVALHMMLWMGAKRIHLVGCDMGGRKDYYDDRVLSDENREINRRLYSKIGNGFMSEFLKIGKEYGVECISCTPDSPLNDKMEFLPLEEAVERSRNRVPQSGGEILNCRDMSKRHLMAEWSETVAPRGIVTACDSNYERLLPWWLQNVRKWSPLPVTIVDLGMSDEMKRWCLQRQADTHIVAFEDPPLRPDSECRSFGLKYGWKPFAAIKSLFNETLFLDVDCEVVGPLDGAFDCLKSHDFAVAKDQLFHRLQDSVNLDEGEEMTQAGVFVCRKGSELVQRWAKACMQGEDGWRKCDQPVLSKIVHEHGDLAGVLPPQYNVLAPLKGNWKAIVDGVTSRPCILHRLTSHPQSKANLFLAAEDRFDVGGIWLRSAEIMEKCEWPNPPAWDKGVVIGVDKNQEWMLPWWLANYGKSNRYPVMIADFGLSDEGREWALKHGLAISQPIELDGAGWFKKPIGCLHSVFRRTVWLDTDVQVKKDIGPLFNYSGVAATLDRGTPAKWFDALPHGTSIYNTGCLSFEWGEPIIQKWAMITMLMYRLQPQKGRLLIPTGDQECFAMAVRQYAPGGIEEMPPAYHALRLGGDPDDSIVKHWTGPDGKAEIKRQMAEMQPPGRAELLKRLPKGGRMAEIGVKNGEFSKQIIQICQPEELHLIDPWKHFESGYEDINNVAQATQDKRYANTRLVLQSYKSPRFHRLKSDDAAERFEDGYFDAVYIDGNHDYDYVKRDLELYAPKVRQGGYMCGHDYCDRPEARGVKRAVDEFRKEHGWDMVMVTTDRWPSFAMKRKGE